MSTPRTGRSAPALFLALLLGAACRTAPADAPPASEVAAVRGALDELYAAFCFDAGGEPDWGAQRRLFLAGASFVPSIAAGRIPVAVDAERFLDDFRAFATGGEYAATGLHERILAARIDAFGGIAHAFVAFEGFTPGDGVPRTRGLDSVQLVHDGAGWRVASFSTQFASEARPLPARFLAR